MRPRKILTMLTVIGFAGAATGCLNSLVDKGGGFLGAKAGTGFAKRLPPPKAAVIVEPKGGSFCGTMKAYRFNRLVPGLSDAEIDALAGQHAGILADLDQHGADHCPGWKAGGS